MQVVDLNKGDLFKFDYDSNSIHAKVRDVEHKTGGIDKCITRRVAFNMQDRWHFVEEIQEENCNPYANAILLTA